MQKYVSMTLTAYITNNYITQLWLWLELIPYYNFQFARVNADGLTAVTGEADIVS